MNNGLGLAIYDGIGSGVSMRDALAFAEATCLGGAKPRRTADKRCWVLVRWLVLSREEPKDYGTLEKVG